MIQNHGYPFENHTLLTDDGYILEIHRIPYGRNISIKDETRPPVLLLPGLFCSSVDWVNVGTEKSLGFILADQGYDVWLANPRGTTWSRKHTQLIPDRDEDFWNFSFHEIAYYDLPVIIDHILNVTHHKSLFYVGHSQGTTLLFILASMKPEYNHKVRLSVALAPSAYLTHARASYDVSLLDLWKRLEPVIRPNELHEVLPRTPMYGTLAQIFCNDYSPLRHACVEIVYFLTGGHSGDHLNKTLIPVILWNTPAGSSVKQLIHYMQMHLSKAFQQYDYGKQMNLKKYGQSKPPKYHLNRVTTPHLLYRGSDDTISIKKDVDKLASKLQNVIVNREIPAFNHLDPLWGIDAARIIYNEVLGFMKKYKDNEI
ncbi:hypothetical protein ILUMI_18430 [Ignelater luminosus]|uniref:Lipase n=1 Tax=Ignelater luminosus TaxID=2038154 RepID=A0A8K0G6W6_IGNLU|nr:hypothetical protein ILUMI_18430 [Ignelater luminosus]